MARMIAALALSIGVGATAISGVLMPANARELTIGRWCNTMFTGFNQEITIRVIEGGDVVAYSRFDGGSAGERPLVEEGGDIFAIEGSSSGDTYRVVPTSGDLQILDDDGLIGVARRLENEPQPGDCLR